MQLVVKPNAAPGKPQEETLREVDYQLKALEVAGDNVLFRQEMRELYGGFVQGSGHTIVSPKTPMKYITPVIFADRLGICNPGALPQSLLLNLTQFASDQPVQKWLVFLQARMYQSHTFYYFQ